MQSTNRIFDDIAKFGIGLLGIAVGVKDALKKQAAAKFEHCARDMNLVTREEFEVVREMAQEARMQADKLAERMQSKTTKGKS